MNEPVYLPPPAQTRVQQRALVTRIVRYAFVVLITTVTLLYILKVDKATATNEGGFILVEGWFVPLMAAAILAAAVLSIDILTPRKKISNISGVFFGLLAGLLATFALGFVVDLLAQTYDIRTTNLLLVAVKVLLGISLCYLGVATVMQTQDDFRLVIPYVEFAKQIRGSKPLILDTSVLIDARIVGLAMTGVFQAPLVVPRFVIGELQQLADSSDKGRRAKGRRGLDVVGRLQRAPTLDVTIDETAVPGKAVDQMLVELARVMPGIVMTVDAALLRVAAIQGVVTLNLHDLSMALRPVHVTGTVVDLQLTRQGEQSGQGVGFLDDGTMVVVEDGAGLIGSTVRVEVTSALQTAAGRMVFAQVIDEDAEGDALDSAGEENVEEAAPNQTPDETAGEPREEPGGVPPGGPAITPPLAPPLTVRPPSAGDVERPIGPAAKARRNPWRNPRR
ncbi:MAG: PIN/TRAM domain-containing protein [Phycisphaerales bacterium]